MSISLKNNTFNLSEGSVYKRLRPTNISVSVLSATSAKLTWANSNNRSDGIRVYSSTDGVNYSRVGSDLPIDTTSYIHNSIDTGSDRYWYVVYFKGPIEGSPSSIVKLDWFIFECQMNDVNILNTSFMVDCVPSASDGVIVFWGDGSSNIYTESENYQYKNHIYPNTGNWTIKIANVQNIWRLVLNDNTCTFNNFNTNQFRKLNNLSRFILNFLTSKNLVINSVDFSHSINYPFLWIDKNCEGTFIINSEHFKNMIGEEVFIFIIPMGTYTINTSHFKYVIDNGYYFGLFLNTANLTKTISRSDFAKCGLGDLELGIGLTQDEVDAILLGVYDAFFLPPKHDDRFCIILSHPSNAAPSGIYRAACPPTSGKEAAYELLHDSCDISDYHWATVDVV